MPHRNMRDALREERERILNELATLEIQAGPEIDERRAQLLSELDEVRTSLEGITPPRHLPLLESLRIARGCTVSWDGMVGSARVRNCGVCEREVYDLTALDPDEIEAFLGERKEKLPCIRLHLRPDGRVQDGPCGPGRTRLLKASALAASLGLLALVSMLSTPAPGAPACAARASRRGHSDARYDGDIATMGEPTFEREPPLLRSGPEPFGWEAHHPEPRWVSPPMSTDPRDFDGIP